MRTPAVNPKIIGTVPVFVSVLLACLAVWYADAPELAPPLVLGIIAGGLVDLDNRLTGRLKNIVFTLIVFSISSLTVQFTINHSVWFVLAMTALTFVFTLLGAIGLRYRTIAFGTLAVAMYTTLTHDQSLAWYVNPAMILCGTLLYSSLTLLVHMLLPHRPVQENVANAYTDLGKYFDAKAAFFDPDDTDQLEQNQIRLAMQNTAVINVFNLCRSSLFYRMRGQHRHPRTMRMLRYYFTAQDIHERISSAHFDYRELAEQLKNTDLIFRIQRLLELQARACKEVGESLRSNTAYEYSERLTRAIDGCKQSLKLYATHNPNADLHSIRRLLDNLSGVDYQLSHLDAPEKEHDAADADNLRIVAAESSSLHHAWHTLKSNLNFESAVFRHTVRLSIVVFIICVLVESLHLWLGYWILLTALFVAQPNYSATKNRINQRIIGTLLGVVVGSMLPYFTPSLETKLWVIVISTTLFYFFRSNKYSFSTFFITIQALTAFSLAGLDMHTALPLRMIDTLIGAALAWAAVSYLWPDWKHLTLERTAARAISYNGIYLKQIVQQLQTGAIDDPAYRSVRRQAHERTAELASTLSDISSEPKKFGTILQTGFELLRLDYTLVSYISALGAYRNHMQPDPEFTQPFYQTANQIAELLASITRVDYSEFAAKSEQIRLQLDALPTEGGNEKQRRILWQQLNMIMRQLAPCYCTLFQDHILGKHLPKPAQ